MAQRTEVTAKNAAEVTQQLLRARASVYTWGSNSDLERRRRNYEQMRLNRIREVWRSRR